MAEALGGLTFDVTSEFSIVETLSSLVSLDSGGGWSAYRWSIWAITADGHRFLLRTFTDEGTARDTVIAYEGQIAASTPREWAQPKGFDELAAHLDALAGRNAT